MVLSANGLRFVQMLMHCSERKIVKCLSITMNGQEKVIEMRPATRDLPHTQIASRTETRKHQTHKNNDCIRPEDQQKFACLPAGLTLGP